MSRSHEAPIDVPDQQFRELRPGGEVESPTLPLPPPRDRDELEHFIRAVAMTPAAERGLVVDTIAGLEERDSIAELLHDALFELPVTDIGRHGVILSIIGELEHASSAEVLERFVWLDDGQVFPAETHHGKPLPGSACHFESSGLLQARAAEMLVWVTRSASPLDAARRVAQEHPHSQVRLASVDACAYVASDAAQVLEYLREIVQQDDLWMVGLPRRAKDQNGRFDVAEFDAAVERHMREFSTEPELPDPDDGVARPQPEGDGDVQ